MRTKKFKTVGGYLNNHYDTLRWAEHKGRKLEERDRVDLHRRTINSLLPQIEVTDSIKPHEEPHAGIARLHAADTFTPRKKKLADIQRWLQRHDVVWHITSTGSSTWADGKITVNRPSLPRGQVVCSGARIVGSNGDGTETHQFNGFSRSDHTKRFVLVLDIPKDRSLNSFEMAEKIAGPDICFPTSGGVDGVPDDCKGILFTREAFYARLPELDPDRRKSRTRRQRA